MNEPYEISTGDPYQLVNDVEQIEDYSNLTELENSLSLVLDEPSGTKGVEQRHHNRFRLNEIAFALIRSNSTRPLNIQGKSMGCIACEVFNSNPARLGKIDNISLGGLMFQHVADKRQLSWKFVLDILSANFGFYLFNIPFKIIADDVIPDDNSDNCFEMKQVRLQFQNLSADQQAMLNEFLFSHGTTIEG